ncbi:hypothetical protein [Mesorhizobium sp.]|uniref:hypothetical protein n=1 Tax=Mesorhizobium sp. TaxID=1871066 RepID=UPI0025F43B5E|nr:hypothetical protein [Mesorhizobium sp.]
MHRFDAPTPLGPVPGERSTGDPVRRSSLTLDGNRRARRPDRSGMDLPLSCQGQRCPRLSAILPWNGQVRLCARYRRPSAARKKAPVVVAAIAREIATFLWAIGQEVERLDEP